jgi:hypothetical protein
MLRKMFWIPALAIAILPAASAHAQKYLDQGTWELTLSGQGQSNQDVNAGTAGLGASVGYFVLDQLELLGRQTVSYSDFNAGTSVLASSAVAVDYHFDLDRFQPFIGAAVGYNYGDSDVDETFFGGPEAGLKYFVKDDTFIYGLVQYQFFFESTDDIDNNFDDGSFVYGVGIGFTW